MIPFEVVELQFDASFCFAAFASCELLECSFTLKFVQKLQWELALAKLLLLEIDVIQTDLRLHLFICIP